MHSLRHKSLIKATKITDLSFCSTLSILQVQGAIIAHPRERSNGRCNQLHRGVTLFQKVGVPIFVSFGSFGEGLDRASKARESRRGWVAGRGLPSQTPSQPGEGPGEGAVPPPQKIFSLLTLEIAHFVGYLMHSDVLLLKL